MRERPPTWVQPRSGAPLDLVTEMLGLPGDRSDRQLDGSEATAETTAPQVRCVVVIAVQPGDGTDGPRVDERDVELLAGWHVDLRRRLTRTRATGARGELTWIDLEIDDPVAVLAVGLGAGATTDLRRAAAAAARRMREIPAALVLAARDLDDAGLRAFTEGLLLPAPTVTWAASPPPGAVAVAWLVVTDVAAAEPVVGLATADATASLRARRLIHTPSNVKDPQWLAEQAAQLAGEAGVGVRVWGPDELAAAGFGGMLAVGAGSSRPPRLVQLSVGAGPSTRHVVLVGKGITFDSGGLSLKPPDFQIPMKTDMSGAAVVCAVLTGLADRQPEGVRVTGLLAVAENLPGAAATRPGDVVTHHGGLRSEVRNTDAEGRLVLADALHFAVADLAADVVVDVATLTGAATLGLGRRYGALFSNRDDLAEALRQAGEAAGEPLWRLPLHAGYRDRIASEVADQANADVLPGAGPGAITAALFLERFVADTPWGHLDIAGVGRSDAERDELPKGGTGFGARALLRWIEAGARF